MKKTLHAFLYIMAAGISQPTTAQEVIFHNEASDTTKITQILIKEKNEHLGGNPALIASEFTGTPYRAHTLEGEKELLRVNLDSMDCTTFVETVAALALTSREGRESWHDFTYNLRRLRYRNGETDGYCSRLHYVSDWIVDNVARGNIKEVTRDIPQAKYGVKTLDYMTRHRADYPALADDDTYQRMRNVESGFSNHRYPFLKAGGLNDKKLAEIIRDGDILVFTTSTPGLDATHMAIATIIDGIPRFYHASQKAGKVILEPLTLANYLRRHRNEGIRILRLTSD